MFYAIRKEIQAMHGEVGQQSAEDANDTKRREHSRLMTKMTNVDRVDKDGNIFITFNGAKYYCEE